MGDKWFVARTEPRAEFLAANELKRDGFEIFSPSVDVQHPRHGLSEVPLFPGYIFIKWDPEALGWPIFRPGHRLRGWVRFGDNIPSIPDETVTELTSRSDEIRVTGGIWKRFKHGEKVRVVSGPIEGLAEVLEAPKSAHGRVRVLMQFMGRLVSTQVDPENLEAVVNNHEVAHKAPIEEARRAPRRTRGRGRWITGFGARVSAPS